MTPSTAHETRVLGDFILGDKLGEGGFGTVYRAEQRTLERAAVIKVMRRSLAANRTAIERFTLEAKLASRFDHPYAAHVYAFGAEPDGLLWIAMELVRGTPLSDMIERTGGMAPERFLPLMERLCEVIQAAHDQGIVHRDIKPSNVMVISHAGRLLPKLLDFGIAKMIDDAAGDAHAPLAGAPNRSPRAHRPTAPTAPVELDRTAAAGTADGAEARTGSLTMEGQILGSPLYMAPEQWIDASRVGPLSDQYALAMLAYEALTGTRAFSGTTLSELLVAHTERPLPEITGLPDAIHAVLARAAAKDPQQRYPSLTELAAAMRAAIAPAAEQEPRVELPADVAMWASDAPRPIAESIAALATARSPVRVADRCAAAAGVIARWLGALAIACRSQLGRLDATADVELLRDLRRRGLRDDEWLDLAAALTAPFAARPEAWPIPELAACANGDAIAALRALVRGDAPLVVVDATANVEHATATAKVAQLATALAGLGWLLDYEVAREAATGFELWMGGASDEVVVRSGTHGRAQTHADTEVTDDRVVVLDADGARVVALSPIVQIAAPSTGDEPKMFVIAGPGHTPDGARFTSAPRGFEIEVDGVWSWLGDHVLATASTAGAAAADADERSPYPGLTAFTGDDAASFVGREHEIDEVVNRLRAQSLVVVVGPSGVGKSSFLAAGVARSVPGTWTAHVVRPGNDPLAALASILERDAATGGYRGERRANATGGDHAALAAELIHLAERLPGTLLIAIDQAEELFTMCSDDAARAAFAAAIAAVMECARVRVVMGVRDDFLCRLEDLAALRGTLARAVQILRVPGVAELERIVSVPARRRGYELDDATLAREIAAEVADRPGALPLLAFACAELWEQRDRHFRRLTRATYDRLGGVTGALVQHADGVVDALAISDRRLVRLAFRRLLAADGTRAMISRGDLIAALGGSAAATRVVERLLAARLIVSRDHESGDRVEIVHEALVTMWPRLADWRREDDAGMRIHQRLATSAKHWDDGGRDAGLLWRGEALADLRRWRTYSELGATPLEAAFADASEADARRARNRRIGAVAGSISALAAGVVVLAGMNRAVTHQKTEAMRLLGASLEERGRLAVIAGDSARGLAYLDEARHLGATGEASDLLVARAAASLASQTGVLAHEHAAIGLVHVDAMTAVVLDANLGEQTWDRATRARTGPAVPDILDGAPAGDRVVMIDTHGTVIATGRDGSPRWRVAADHPRVPGDATPIGVAASADAHAAVSFGPTAKLWDLDSGHARGELSHGDKPIGIAAFDRGGHRVATGDVAGGIRVWDATTGAAIATCTGHTARVRALKFSPDDSVLVSGGADGLVLACDPATGAILHRFEGHTNVVSVVDITADGHVASAGFDNTARLWNLATGHLDAVLEGHAGSVLAATFSPDGAYLATAGFDDTIRIWDARTDLLVATLDAGVPTPVVDWEPSGTAVVTAGNDGTIRRWDVTRAMRGHTAPAQTGAISELQVTRDDRYLLAAGPDGVAISDARTLAPHARLATGNADAVRLSPDGATAIVSEDAGGASLWSIGGAKLGALAATDVNLATFAPDGTILSADNDHTVRWWSRAGAEVARVDLGYPGVELTFDPSGAYAVATGMFTAPGASSPAVIDVRAHRVVAHLAGTHAASAVAVDATRAVTGDGNDVRIWDLATGAALATLSGHHGTIVALAILADGRIVSAGDDRVVLVWDRDGRLAASLPVDGSKVVSIATSADGALFATGGQDGTVRVWDAATSRAIVVQPSHRGMASYVVFGHGGDRILSGGSDGRVASWTLAHPTRSLDELDQLVRCRVPYRLDGDTLLPRDLDYADASCDPSR